MKEAFFSYAAKDENIASELYRVMERNEIDTFMAEISIKPGKKWKDEIFANLNKAKWIFFLATKNSCKSQNVHLELGGALAQKKIIIPVLIDVTPEELPDFIRDYQAIDFNKSPESLFTTIKDISEEIKSDKLRSYLIMGLSVAFVGILFMSLRKR